MSYAGIIYWNAFSYSPQRDARDIKSLVRIVLLDLLLGDLNTLLLALPKEMERSIYVPLSEP
jgi:hypothetical protein